MAANLKMTHILSNQLSQLCDGHDAADALTALITVSARVIETCPTSEGHSKTDVAKLVSEMICYLLEEDEPRPPADFPVDPIDFEEHLAAVRAFRGRR